MGTADEAQTHGTVRVFLSYARPDAERAHSLADALGARGFSVWCDRQLEGGAAFASTIEDELAAADAVVVAWSAASTHSDWVRDEAAVGRDKGRLVPVRLDATLPPIGFRQYQAIDLSGWTGAADNPAIDRVVRAVEKIAAGKADGPHAASPALDRPKNLPRAFALGGALFAAIAGLAVWKPWTQLATAPTAPTIAVLPFLDLSHTADGRAFSEGVAEDILALLARDPRLHVLGRTSAAMLAAHAGDPRAIERDLGVTHLLEGSVRSTPGRAKVDVRLLRLPGQESIFADSFDRRLTDIFAVQDEIGQAVAARLGGALGTTAAVRAASAPQTVPEVYTRYLAARQLVRTRQPAEMKRAATLLREATAADPRYAPAFAALAEVSILLAADQYGDTPRDEAVAAARGYAMRAAAIAPNLGDTHAALGEVAIEAGEAERAIAEFRHAVALDPHKVETLNWLGYALSENGDLSEAAKVMRQAVALEPLWFRPRVTAIFTLHQIGADQEIARMAASFAPIAPDPLARDRVAMAAAFQLARFGEAVTLAQRIDATTPGDPQAGETLAGVGINLFVSNLALSGLGNASGMTLDMILGKPDAAIARALRAGAALWDSPNDVYYAATAFVARSRWADLVALYDARYRSPEAWLERGIRLSALDLAPTIAFALDRVGRAAEARRMRALTAARLSEFEARGLVPNSSAWLGAALLTANGNKAGAIARLAAAAGSINPAIVCGGPTRLDHSPELGRLATDPGFRAVVASCDAWIRRQRASLPRG